MAILSFCGKRYTVDHAVKGVDYIHGYDAAGLMIVSFEGVTDFSKFTYDGEYMSPEMCEAEVCNKAMLVNGALRTKDGRRVSAEHVGAAPSGYGLGETSPNSKDINTEKTNGYFRTTSATANSPFLHGAGHVRTYNADEVVQNVFRVLHGLEFVRYTTDGGATWIEEAVNPAMVIGTEYRTTKRYNGEVVYTKLIEYGALPNATASSISVSNLNAKYIVSAKGMLDNGCPFPYMTTNASFGYIHLFVNGPSATGSSVGIRIETTTDCSKYNGYILLEYTKKS